MSNRSLFTYKNIKILSHYLFLVEAKCVQHNSLEGHIWKLELWGCPGQSTPKKCNLSSKQVYIHTSVQVNMCDQIDLVSLKNANKELWIERNITP